MGDYTPPLREIRFVIEELAGLHAVPPLPGGEQTTGEDAAAILAEAGRFASDILSPLNPIGDREGCQLDDRAVTTPAGFPDAYNAFRDGGWCAISAAPDQGGHGVPSLVATAAAEIWSAANLSFALCTALTQSAVSLIAEHASDALKEQWLPRMVSGEWTGAMAMTEPQAGSDIGALTCRAEPDGDRYRLKGQKIFISWGEHDLTANIIHLVLARLPDAPEGHRGISLFLVPKFLGSDGAARNDIHCLSLESKLGLHASPTCVMQYGGNEGAIGWLVGKPNRGLAAMFTMMNAARLAIGHQGLGIAERAWQSARDYAKERLQGRSQDGDPAPIIHHADVRRMLLSMKARIEAMRALAYDAALASDLASRHADGDIRSLAAARVALLTPVVKAWCTDGAVEVASTAIQIHGGAGYIEDTGVAQYLRDARITPIYEGTNGIQAQDLVRRKLIADEGAAMRTLIKEMRQFNGLMAESTNPDVLAIRARMTDAGAALARATDHLLATEAQDRTDAGATPYQELAGIVIGGYGMARAAVIAERHIAGGNDADGFYAAKLATARFYADSCLSQATALEQNATEAATRVAEYPQEFF
jgi:alkylation response protein AidB-like acyl-CoA dehydrogenase